MEETENKTKYLYGASVQGIQNFIFQTNKLKEIVGASELVEYICTTAFEKYAKAGESIIRAAGNIKCIFSNRKDCEEVVRNFPREVMNKAPGITISQAVVTLEADESDYAIQSNELEELLRAQRNKASRSMTLGLMAINRAPSTGLPAVVEQDGELIDAASDKKIKQDQATKKLIKKSFGKELKHEEIAYNIEDITGKNDWIAVIHADGNGMGSIFQEVGKYKNDMKLISPAVNEITEYAAQQAFTSVENDFHETTDRNDFPGAPQENDFHEATRKSDFIKTSEEKNKGFFVIPIRPIVLGGDDLTLICRADLAMKYVKTFLEKFEAASKGEEDREREQNNKAKLGLKHLKLENDSSKKAVEKGLTACAGIAFVKSSYPFHYAVHLAESLCKRAKTASKGLLNEKDTLPPSCLMFHKVQDSFVEDFKEIVQRELTPPKTNLSFEYGPYYCGRRASEPQFNGKCNHTVKELIRKVGELKEKKAKGVKANLRQWLSLLFDDVEFANQKMKRMREISDFASKFVEEDYESLKVDTKNKTLIPFHDILALSSIEIITKTKEGKK